MKGGGHAVRELMEKTSSTLALIALSILISSCATVKPAGGRKIASIDDYKCRGVYKGQTVSVSITETRADSDFEPRYKGEKVFPIPFTKERGPEWWEKDRGIMRVREYNDDNTQVKVVLGFLDAPAYPMATLQTSKYHFDLRCVPE